MIQISVKNAGSETLEFASSELNSYLNEMLPDQARPVEISLMADRMEGEELSERFAVSITAEGGTITGSDPRAVLLGVYDYLRRLGCRFLGPGKQCEVVPVIGQENLAADYEKQASFRHRGVCIEGADSRENVLDFIDWLPKIGYNSFFLQFKNPYAFLKRWYHHEGNPLREAEDYTPADAERDMEDFESACKRRGLLLHKVGHGWTGEVLGYEALSWDTDAKPLADDKRPLAALVGGERCLWQGVPANTNLCLSNPRSVDTLASLVVDYAWKNPAADYVHVWMADMFNNVCECEDCQQSSLSDQYVSVLNEIDRRLTALELETRIVFLLYQELLWPPVRERLNNPDRFVLMFAPISRTFERSYQAGGELPSVPDYERNRVTLPTDLPQNLSFLRAWQEIFQGDSFVYDYPLGRAHYGDFGYLKISRVISGDVKQLKDLGLNGYISCQELRAGLPNFFPNYVLGRTLMDESADVNELMGEYFAAAYGEDWPVAADYLSRLSSLSDTDYVNGKGSRQDAGIATRMEMILELCMDFAPTLDAHQDAGSWETPFWELLGFQRDYVLKLARALRALSLGEEVEAGESWREFRQCICEKEPEFQSWLDVYRVLEVTEKYTGFRCWQS